MIETSNLTKIYERGDRPALSDVSLNIDKGEFVFLSGPSGAGKTTLLRMFLAQEKPTSGHAIVNGRNIGTLKPREIPLLRREVGVIFQDFKLIQTATVFENVSYTLRVLGLSQNRIQKRVFRALKEVDLLHKQSVLPQRLSGGEQQRVAIARALVNDPAVLLADEPTGNLDQSLTEEVVSLLDRANARGTTVILATHDLGLMERHPRRVLHLQDGQLAHSG